MSRSLTALGLIFSLGAAPALAGPQVTVDIAPVHSLVASVMGDVGTPELLIPSATSPHDFSLRPSQAQALQDADVVVWVGPALLPWMEETVGSLAPSAISVELQEADGVTLFDFREETIFEHEDDDHAEHKDHDHDEHAEDKHDDHDHAEHKDHDHDDHAEKKHDDHHDHGHDHGGVDPHIWLSPANARIAAGAIRDALSKADPDNASTYSSNADALIAELDALEAELIADLKPIHDVSYIVMHDAYQYFEKAFDVGADASIAVGDAAQPGAARLRELQEHIAEHKISCVFSEPQISDKLVDTITENTSLKRGVLDPLGSDIDVGPDHYAAMMRKMAGAMTGCMGS